MTEQLKPCPRTVCGGAATLDLNDEDFGGVFIHCTKCSLHFWAENKETAVDEWNNRPSDDVVEALRDALQPFADLADVAEKAALTDSLMTLTGAPNDDDCATVTIGKLRKAKAALAALEESIS